MHVESTSLGFLFFIVRHGKNPARERDLPVTKIQGK